MQNPKPQDDPLLLEIARFRTELDRLLDAEVARLGRSASRSGSPASASAMAQGHRPSTSMPSEPTHSLFSSMREGQPFREREGLASSRPEPSDRSRESLTMEAESNDAGQRLDALAKRLQGQARRTQRQDSFPPASTEGK